jgi:hypothetical protein
MPAKAPLEGYQSEQSYRQPGDQGDQIEGEGAVVAALQGAVYRPGGAL